MTALPFAAVSRGRYPLYNGLVATLAGMVLAAGLGYWGLIDMVQRFERVMAPLLLRCPPGAAAPAICSELGPQGRVLYERISVMLLLEGLCLGLVLVGALMLGRRAYEVLVKRSSAIASLTSAGARSRARDEIDSLVESLAELTARQAGLEAEGRWQQQISGDQLRLKGLALETLHQVARMFCEGEVSEAGLRNGLALLESALVAETVALVLDDNARQALGTGAVIATRGQPLALGTLDAALNEAGETTARLVPASAACAAQSLVVTVCRGKLPVGSLVAQFPAAARIDGQKLRLAESFAHLSALAISGLSRSLEERRVALMEERSAIAGELHDSLAQSLAFMKIQVSRLQREVEGDSRLAGAAQVAQELRKGLSAAYRDVRELIAAFRVRMGPGGLLAAVQEAIDEFSQRSGLEIGFEHRLGRCQLEVNEEFHVLQVVREGLSNAVRHARAQNVWVRAEYGPAHRLMVTIEDDGRGLASADDREQHYGLDIMQERARSLGGEVCIEAREAGGLRVRLAFAPQRLPSASEEPA